MATPHRDYTQVPYESKHGFGSNRKPYVKGKPYAEGQDFYPDRIWRDEMSARNQWFQDKDFQSSGWGQDLNQIQKAIDAGKRPARDYGVAQDRMVKRLNEFQLRNTPQYDWKNKQYFDPATGPFERPGGNYGFNPSDYFYLEALDKSRQKQFQKYDPYWGMTEKQWEDKQDEQLEGALEKRYKEEGYGWARPEGDEKWTDMIQAASSGIWGGIGSFTDLASNIVKNAPYEDEVHGDRTIPKGLIDTAIYQYQKSAFEKEKMDQEGMDLAKAWLNLPREQRDKLNADFKERSGYDYTHDLDPWWFENAPTRDFTDWAFHGPAEDIQSRMHMEDWDPLTFNLPEKLGGEWTPFEGIGGTTWPEVVQKISEFGPGWILPSKLLTKGQSLASSPITKQLNKIPYIGKYLSGLVGPKAQTGGLLSLATWLDATEGEDRKWPDLKPEWLEEWPDLIPEWPSNDPKGILESLSKE